MTLIKYLFKKILMLIPVLIGISIVAFALGVSSPGDPVDQVLNPTGDDTYTQEQYDAMAEKMGLDEPLPVQYLNWVKNLSRGDLGRSFFTQKSILEQLQKRIPLSMRLALYAMVLITVFGVGFGILMAMFKDSLLDHILGGICTVALSVPGFWIAIVLIYIFAEELKILPTSGLMTPAGYILPSVTLALPSIGVCARLTRSAILDEIGRQYVLVADAKGLKHRQTVFRHAFVNALIPVITYLGNHMAGILGGASIVETIFALPGIGSYAISAVQSKDYYVVQAYVLFSGSVYVLMTILIDLIYIAINPKIRAGEEVG
ncbi:ABC transporter, permease protein [Marvinbryantia formatexigens DSM 14469]|uniref:ABC transporter, permease protein n=1 Tax=Marvinbryantia formatexigens DSM 14469 TaxID=478749 RepID=C6LB15_9FIRM|nr:ABC transporter permease [Marvinbryantia formatexigens]EET62146.1 ABC transporter, permease protein [Marvinbryantia formatexigens DSM 14469]UWO26509.1 ABC transporter permease [Marvinbryantia formatexigens DSM 14469]SDF78002.1 peptide/nickel transport system permease protein [Marvinbryantia formatexigens]